MAVLAVVVAVGSMSWLLPQATAPTWDQPLNQDPSYPRELLATGNPDAVPVVGESTGYAFVRIALVKRIDGKTVLADPYSDTIFRTVTAEEERIIGSNPYAIDRYGKPADGQLMLTFDDGPNAAYTTQILDVLEEEDVPATFFAIGENVVANPDVFQRIVDDGHMVGNHTMNHLTDWTESDERHREELIATDRAMRSVADYASRLFRMPEGNAEFKPLALLQAQQLGYLHVDMDLDTWDWTYDAGEKIPVPDLNGEGHIVVMHDGGLENDRSATVDLLRELIREAKAEGYTFTTMEPMLEDEYVPTSDADSGLVDDTSTALTAAVKVAPDAVNATLFWFWTGSLAIVCLFYITLALIGHRRQQRRVWRDVPDAELPLVTVVLPVFNEEPVVARTLDSLRASDYPNLEVVAVNDGSTDNTLQILEEYALTWPSLRVVTQPNGGKSMASNHGIMLAKGEIVVTLDGDTLFEPQTIRMLARHFYDPSGNRPVGAVAGHVKVGNRKNILTAWQSLEYLGGICVNRMAESVANAISVAPGACTAWRTEALRQAGGYSHDTLAEDMDLTLSMHRLGYSVRQENQAIAWTEAPMTVRSLAKQRLRWTYGNLQVLWKHSDMILRPKFGVLGMLALPYNLFSFFVYLVLLPVIALLVVATLVAGNWQDVLVFAAFGVILHAMVSVIAIRMVRESPWHLLIVPIYRFIFEPLRAYLIYAALIQALKGKMIGWYKPERTNSVIELDEINERAEQPANA